MNRATRVLLVVPLTLLFFYLAVSSLHDATRIVFRARLPIVFLTVGMAVVGLRGATAREPDDRAGYSNLIYDVK